MNILEEITKRREEYLRNLEQQIKLGQNALCNLEKIGQYTRPIITIAAYKTIHFGTQLLELGKKVQIVMDDNVRAALEKEGGNGYSPEREYNFYRTSEKSNDVEIIPALKTAKLVLPADPIATALHLIALDLISQGPLYDISLDGHENINTGYTLLKDETQTELPHVVFVEKLKNNEGVYHIHSNVVPRPYKAFRYLLDDMSA